MLCTTTGVLAKWRPEVVPRAGHFFIALENNVGCKHGAKVRAARSQSGVVGLANCFTGASV